MAGIGYNKGKNRENTVLEGLLLDLEQILRKTRFSVGLWLE